jgi:hypothetical protein
MENIIAFFDAFFKTLYPNIYDDIFDEETIELNNVDPIIINIPCFHQKNSQDFVFSLKD